MFAAHSYLPIVNFIISKPVMITFWVIMTVIGLVLLFRYRSNKYTENYNSICAGAFVKFKVNRKTVLEGYLVRKYRWSGQLLIRTDNLESYTISFSDVIFFFNRNFYLEIYTYWKTNSEELMFVKRDNGDGSYVLVDSDGCEAIYKSHFAFNPNWDLKKIVPKEEVEKEIFQSDIKKLTKKEQTLRESIKIYQEEMNEMRTGLNQTEEEYWEMRKEHKKAFQALKKLKNFMKKS